MTGPTITLHGLEISGHTHRVVLLLRMLDLPYRLAPVPRDFGKSPAFLRLNPLGQVPVLEDRDLVLADSNAILVYLAKRYAPAGSWLPEEPIAAARVQRWLSIAAGEVAFGPALARAIAHFGVPADRESAARTAGRMLRFMADHLAARRFLAAEHPTIADLACYSYVRRAPEGGISLEPFPAIEAWLRRIEALPGFVAMPDLPIPAVK